MIKAYILSIAGMILASAVVTILCPSGKMGKFVKGTSRLLLLAVMIAPLAGLAGSGKPELETGQIGGDSAYLEACARLLEERDEAEIAALLREEYALSAEVAVRRGISAYFPLEKITARLDLSGINGEEARINIMTRVREDLGARYRTEAEVYDGFP